MSQCASEHRRPRSHCGTPCAKRAGIALLFALVFGLSLRSPARADDLASYLEQHGLTQLLAVHFEEQLAAATGEQKEAIVKRLADLYAQLLERETDPARRVAIETKSRQLLEQAPARSADDLRLALLRASYRTAEKIAENHRLRLADDEELATARRTFDEIVPQLLALSTQMRESIAAQDRRLSRASGVEATTLSEAIERERAQHSQTVFLAAWSLYYQAWLADNAAGAKQAEPLFAELMGTESSTPNPDDVSLDLRANEAVARSILGMALSKSLTSSPATALAWIDLLADEGVYEPLRSQVAAWAMYIYLEHRNYRDTLETLTLARNAMPEVPLGWLRLAAVYALEDTKRDQSGDAIVRLAVTELAARGELQQVIDLATRYGVDALGDSGFALKYVEGVIGYQAARKKHGNESPTFDAKLRAQYRDAADALKAASAEPDADKYPLAAAACQRLIAWCSYFQGNFLDAQREFESAATALSGAEAADALWMSIVSLDKVAESGRSVETQAQLDALMDRYIAQFPNDANTAKLKLKRSVNDGDPSPDAVAELLAISPGSDVYAMAQRRAADMLYQLFRKSSGNDRLAYAGQFLSVAVPLISHAPAPGEETQRFAVRGRQILETALTENVERLVAARAAFAALDELASVDPAVLAPHRDEIDCRRAQERLLADDLAAAGALADGLWERDSTSIWSRLAMRAMFKQAYRVWKSEGVIESNRSSAIDRVVRYGGRVLHEFKDDSAGLDRQGAIGYYAAVADASMAVWERTRDQEKAKAALFLFDTLLAKRGNNASYLRAAAILSEACEQQQKALDHWRRLVSGTSVGSEGWFEAKFHQIQLLSKLDPSRARGVMNQHKQLNPDFGPDPWGSKLKGLDELIPLNPSATPATPSTTAEPVQGEASP